MTLSSDRMRSKKEIESDIGHLKEQLSELSSKNVEMKKISETNSKEGDAAPQMFLLLKYMIEENKRTTLLLKHISDSISRLEESLDDSYYEEEPSEKVKQQNQPQQVKELMLSETDTKILQFIQISRNSMSCADEIREKMHYRGRNAASARLNRLYKLGIVDRYQLGHKVYYKFDVGKATKTLIVSPT